MAEHEEDTRPEGVSPTPGSGGPPDEREHPTPTRRRFLWGAAAAAIAASAAVCAWVGGLGRRALRTISRFPASDPPYIGEFKVNTVESSVPEFDPSTWRLTVDGLVGKAVELDWSELLGLPAAGAVRDFKCVEGWGVEDVRWEGVHVGELISRAVPKEGATHVVFHASGGVYTDALTLKEARDPRVMLAYRLNGKELDPRQGRPLRLIVPWMYGYKGPKWVERLELVDGPHNGYWERRGYPIDATIRT